MARSRRVLPLPEGPLIAMHSPADNENEADLRRSVRRSRTWSSGIPRSVAAGRVLLAVGVLSIKEHCSKLALSRMLH